MISREKEVIDALRAITALYIEMMDGGMNDPRQTPEVQRALRILEQEDEK